MSAVTVEEVLFDNGVRDGERAPTDEELGEALAWASTLAVKRCYIGAPLRREDREDLAQDIAIQARRKVSGYRIVDGKASKVPLNKYCYVACCFVLYEMMKKRSATRLWVKEHTTVESALWEACVRHVFDNSEKSLHSVALAMAGVWKNRNHDAYDCDVVSGEEIFKGL